MSTNGTNGTDGKRLTAAHRRAPSDLRNAARRLAEALRLDGRAELAAAADRFEAETARALDAWGEARRADDARG